MAARIGIELGPVACRVVELEPRRAAAPGGANTLVRSCGAYLRPGYEMREALETLRGSTASVVVWGLSADHTQVVVARGSYERMRREALARRGSRGIVARMRLLADIAPAGMDDPTTPDRPVVLVSAASATVAAALDPVRAAGIRVRSVVTPAAALMSAARWQRRWHETDAPELYVALAETTTAMALRRDGALAWAEEVDGGYLDPDRGLVVRHGEQLVEQLACQLERFVEASSMKCPPPALVYICGGLPDLRTMTLALIDRLGVEVEPLDSLFGIETTSLPDHGADLAERSAEFRLAWAGAADWPPPLDLFRERRQHVQRAWIARAAVAAGMTTGLGLGYGLVSSGPGSSILVVDRVAVAPVRRAEAPQAPEAPTSAGRVPGSMPVASPARRQPAPVARRRSTPETPFAPEATQTVARVEPPTAARPASTRTRPPALRPSPQAAPSLPSAVPAQLEPRREEPQATRPVALAPPSRAAAAPVRTPPVASAPPVAPSRSQTAERRDEPTIAPADFVRSYEPPPEVAHAPSIEPALPVESVPESPEPPPSPPFEAELQTILYAPERKLAFIDGRIVEPGDEIRGVRVVDITATAVVVQDRYGRVTRLHVGRSAP